MHVPHNRLPALLAAETSVFALKRRERDANAACTAGRVASRRNAVLSILPTAVVGISSRMNTWRGRAGGSGTLSASWTMSDITASVTMDHLDIPVFPKVGSSPLNHFLVTINGKDRPLHTHHF